MPAAAPDPTPGPIALTLGDAAGIGPEIIAKAFAHAPDVLVGCFVAGDLGIMRRAVRCVSADDGPTLPVVPIESIDALAALPPQVIPVLQIGEAAPPIAWGKVQAQAGALAARCVEWAADAALRGEVAALVTAPLHKEALAAAGVPYPGHTELLQARAAAYTGRTLDDMPVRMMLANDDLRVVLVSIHVALREAIEAVRFDTVLETLRISHRALGQLLGRTPRLAVAGLNPHAGEGGLFGCEEIDIIAPAIAAAQAEGIAASGPYPPDTVFMNARNGSFDAVVAMYHDQGLIPLKYLGVDQGVNVTLGLPLVRTSPDHGTAFDLAGTGRATAASFIAAVRMARQLVSVACV